MKRLTTIILSLAALSLCACQHDRDELPVDDGPATIVLSLADAQDLMRICEPGIIDKTRYLVRCGEHIFEVDEFYGDNEGLVMAEVELGSEDEPFEKPSFIGREVTGDRRFYNSHLRRNPYCLWKDSI